MKRLLFVLIVALAWARAVAQDDVAFTNYWSFQSFYNPAAAGVDKQLDIKAAFRIEMMGFEDSGRTFLVQADAPLWFLSSPRHGGGVGFMNDKIGLFEHKRFFVHYAYHQRLWGRRLSVGVRAGLLAESFDGTGVDVVETGDPAFPSSEVNGTAFDLDGGLRYDGKRWYAGFSVAHALAPMVSLGDTKANEFEVPQTFYLTGGYNIRLRNPLLSMQTSAIVRTDLTAWRGDATARLCYNGPKGKMYVGVGYSPTISASVLIGGDFHGVQLGYCYEIYTSGVGALQGTHELSIGYTTDLNLFKKGKNRHQSVRIL